MINHMMTDKYGPEWSSFYDLEEILDYLYRTDDRVLLGSEYPDMGIYVHSTSDTSMRYTEGANLITRWVFPRTVQGDSGN
jgi:hypothetical protein